MDFFVEFPYQIGRLIGFFAIPFVIAAVVYSFHLVKKRRRELNPRDSPWENEEEDHPKETVSDLDEWDKRYLAGEISEAEWRSHSR